MSDANIPQVQQRNPNLLLRSDTFLGVCEALGEDFGFNPNWLRVALSAALLWNPYAIVGTYLGLGLLVAASRYLFPKPAIAEAATAAPEDQAAEPGLIAAETPTVCQQRELVAA